MSFQKVTAVEFLVLAFLCMEFNNSHLVLGEARCVEREREALVRFKKGLIDDGGFLSSWGSEDSCCEWKGVVCSNTTSNSHVIALLLGNIDLEPPPFQPLRGNITDALLELHHLTNLDLNWNQFDSYQFPLFMTSMKQLEHLNLQATFLYGTVPPQLRNLTNLRTLDLSFNSLRSDNLNWLSHLSLLTRLDLTSSFDLSRTNWLPQILKLPLLQELYLSNSNIATVIPSANSSFASLSILDLSLNKFTSSELDWLSTINTSLAKIDVSYNELDGPVPDVFGKLVFLEDLDLSNNMLEGGVSKLLGNLSHVQTLYLSSNGFRGHLEQLFGNLTTKVKMSLESLYLSHNQLNGSLLALEAFPALKRLNLGSNKFVGTMPKLHSVVEEIDVSFNSLEGTITEAYFTQLHNLKALDLSFSSLTLQISQDWSPPFQLDYITLAGCNMSPPQFPKWIQTQRNLRSLDLSSAGISDEVPTWLWSSSPALSRLNISHNNITGNIPHLSSTSDIYSFDVSSNKLSGSLPLLQQNIAILQLSNNMFSGSISSICLIPLVRIWFLDLSNNHFSGEIPNCWDNITDLFYLNMGDNNFSGEIPHTLGALWSIDSLNLRGNSLSGELPSTLQNCTDLMFIDLGGNKLTGNVPAWIGEIKNLMYVILSRNNFYGSIPRQICSLAYIRVLDLSRNNISEEIPGCFDKLVSLTEHNATIPSIPSIFYDLEKQFEYAFVQWKGGEFEYKKNLRHLKLIDLSSNKLVGSIPESFSSMRELVSLNLSRNLLTGTIISDIGEMKMLEVLDLSRNQLSGKIPISLGQLHFLAVMDLENNSLSGRIPSSTQLQSFDASVYGGNAELCGLPLKMCPEEVLNPSITDQEESFKKDGDIIMSLSFIQGFLISIAFGFIVGFWGVVASLVLKRSWRYAYFSFSDEVKDWMFWTAAKLFKTSTPM